MASGSIAAARRGAAAQPALGGGGRRGRADRDRRARRLPGAGARPVAAEAPPADDAEVRPPGDRGAAARQLHRRSRLLRRRHDRRADRRAGALRRRARDLAAVGDALQGLDQAAVRDRARARRRLRRRGLGAARRRPDPPADPGRPPRSRGAPAGRDLRAPAARGADAPRRRRPRHRARRQCAGSSPSRRAAWRALDASIPAPTRPICRAATGPASSAPRTCSRRGATSSAPSRSTRPSRYAWTGLWPTSSGGTASISAAPMSRYAEADAAARRALQIDESQAAAYAVLSGLAKSRWEWQEAEALRTARGRARPELRAGAPQLWHLLAPLGRLEESRREIELAVRLDPLSAQHGVQPRNAADPREALPGGRAGAAARARARPRLLDHARLALAASTASSRRDPERGRRARRLRRRHRILGGWCPSSKRRPGARRLRRRLSRGSPSAPRADSRGDPNQVGVVAGLLAESGRATRRWPGSGSATRSGSGRCPG